MKAVILGGGGFLGSHLCQRLIEKNHQVRVFDLPGAAYLSHARQLGAGIFIGDFMNPEDIHEAIKDMDVIYHLISTTVPKTSNNNPQFDIQTNLVGFIKILEEARKVGGKKIVFTSSGGTVYGVPQDIPIKESHPTNPICSYGIHKLAIEKYLQMYHHLYDLDYCILRISNAYGERQPAGGSQGVIATFLQKAQKNEEILIWGDGSVVRDYIHASDVSIALVKAAKYDGETNVFNIGSGKGHNLNQIIDVIQNISGNQLYTRHLPGRPFDVPNNVLNIERAKAHLIWQPVISFDEGITLTWQSLTKKPKKKSRENDLP